MHLSPIESSDGRKMWSVGGTKAWKTFEYKGFHVSLEWAGRVGKAQAVMCIWPATNVFVPGSSEAGVWVIGRRAITDFVGFNANDKCTGGPSEHCWREAQQALPILGKDINDREALKALVDVVVKFAPELVLVPATPRELRKAFSKGDVAIELTTKVTDRNGNLLRRREAQI